MLIPLQRCLAVLHSETYRGVCIRRGSRVAPFSNCEPLIIILTKAHFFRASLRLSFHSNVLFYNYICHIDSISSLSLLDIMQQNPSPPYRYHLHRCVKPASCPWAIGFVSTGIKDFKLLRSEESRQGSMMK